MNMARKQKVVVTGGAGYIGSVLVPTLLHAGYEVVVLDSFIYRQQSLLDCAFHKNLKIVRGDARDEASVRECMSDATFIIPLAGLVGVGACLKDPSAAVSTNLDAVKMILKLRSREQKIVFPNTNSGYGIGTGEVHCDENTPMNPISLYGRTKVDAEHAVLDAGDAVVFRLATVFGTSPRMRIDLLVNSFVYRALKDRYIVLFESHFKRNFIHVRDVVRAFLHAMEHFETMKNEPYNVGLSDANISKMDLCLKIKEYIPKFDIKESETEEDPDKRNYVVSNVKIESTGFKPQFSLDHGIQELIRGFSVFQAEPFINT